MEQVVTPNDVRRLIANNKTNDAIKTLLSVINSGDFRNEAILQSSRFKELEKQLRLGIVDYELAQITKNQINYALIELVQEIDNLAVQNTETEQYRRKVFVHFFDTRFHTPGLKMLIKYQNHIQQLFNFEISGWEDFHLKEQKEKEAKNLKANSKLAAVNRLVGMVRELPKVDRDIDTLDIVLTSQLLIQRYYAWNSEDRKGILISIGRLQEVFTDFNLIHIMVIRVIQRMLIFSLNIPNLQAHLETRHCVFDMTIDIRDLKKSVQVNYLCKNCETIIAEAEQGKSYLRKINRWIDSLILN